MFVRALIAFIALPGVAAFIIPAAWLWHDDHLCLVQPWGLLWFALGVPGLLWCVRDFYVSGRGTLAPWAPPKTLVVLGLYRYSRNPMYVSVVVILVAWAISFSSMPLLVYALLVAVAFHLRVVLSEEPWLARVHGDQWKHYASRVPRWFWRTAREL